MPSYAAQLLRHRSTIVWAILVLATIVSWRLGTNHGFAGGAKLATSVVLVIAFAKVAMVTTTFMEVHEAPRLLRLIVHGWTIIVCSLLVTLYLVL